VSVVIDLTVPNSLSWSNMTALSENGAVQLSSTGESRVDLFFNAVRSTSPERVNSLVKDVLCDIFSHSHTAAEKSFIAADLFCQLFHLRATRGMGKGERDLFIHAFVQLHQKFPSTTESLVQEIPHFGSWKDLLEIMVHGATTDSLKSECTRVFANQLKQDAKILDESESECCSLSLAGKWAPREGKAYDRKGKVVDALCLHLFDSPSAYSRRKEYRRLLSRLNAHLDVPERSMSTGKWAHLDFKKVPAVCLERHRKAFLNEHLHNCDRHANDTTGNRHPNDKDRIACRQNLVKILTEGCINGSQLFPHQIVQKITPYAVRSSVDDILCNAQWKAIRESVLASMAEALKQSDLKQHIHLGNLVPLVDVSGSMSGEPMEVAIALGILVSEVTADSFKNRVLTFDSQPQWFVFDKNDTLVDKVCKLRRAPWGCSTNFALALKKIYEVVKRNKLSEDQIPNLIVFSDMQFNAADHAYLTNYEDIVYSFAFLGKSICGKPYSPPKIIFWNLRGNSSSGVHAPCSALSENVQCLSGFSGSLLKLVISCDELVENTSSQCVHKKKVTPYATLRKAMDHENFDRIRKRCAESNECVFESYTLDVYEKYKDAIPKESEEQKLLALRRLQLVSKAKFKAETEISEYGFSCRSRRRAHAYMHMYDVIPFENTCTRKSKSTMYA
jgi:hypothetical protein